MEPREGECPNQNQTGVVKRAGLCCVKSKGCKLCLDEELAMEAKLD